MEVYMEGDMTERGEAHTSHVGLWPSSSRNTSVACMHHSPEPWRGLRPIMVVNSHAISAIEQRVHVLLVKRLIAVSR
jgi:hypothetical protein